MNRREKLFQAGVQFGHRTQCWCPKMSPFIWGKKDGIHLINVALTDIQMTKAEALLESIAAKGLPILWVGTKKIARSIVSKFAQECHSPFFANRWVGGTLTNYQEVKKAVKKMLYNEEIYQKTESQDIYTKKELCLLQKKVERSKKIISGIEKLSYPIGALIVTDVQKDKVAVKEAIRIGVPVIGFVDTNADPEGITVVIPTNDDLEDALAIISQYLSAAINKGKETFLAQNKIEAEKEAIARAEKQEEKKSDNKTKKNTFTHNKKNQIDGKIDKNKKELNDSETKIIKTKVEDNATDAEAQMIKAEIHDETALTQKKDSIELAQSENKKANIKKASANSQQKKKPASSEKKEINKSADSGKTE